MSKLTLIPLFIATLATTLMANAKEESWRPCYNEDNKTLYFVPASVPIAEGCKSETFYRNSADDQDYNMITSEVDNMGFSHGVMGSEQIVGLENGKTLLITQWSNGSKGNLMLVLEPNLRTHRVRVICKTENFGVGFNYNYVKSTNSLDLEVLRPTNKPVQTTRAKVTCKL